MFADPVTPLIPADALILSSAILATLVLGSVAGMLLKRFVARGRPHATIDNIVLRVKAWWAISALLGLAWLVGPMGVVLLFAWAMYLAFREFVTSGGGGGTDARRVLAGATLCAGVAFAPGLLWLDLPGHAGCGGYLMMFLLLVSQLGDVFQYIWGKLAGRHALAPRISPSKTVEGLLGGMSSASILGAALAWMTPFSPWQAAGLALLVSLLGVLGGLLLSAEKRRRGIKDWGTLVAGHGGMLDRLDSVYLSAPGFYLAVWLGWG